MQPPMKIMSTKADKRRSLQSSHRLLPICNLGKRERPPTLPVSDLNKHHNDHYFEALQKNHLWFMTRQMETSNQEVCSWTGFNMITKNLTEVCEDVVGYLPTINAPATEMSTVQEILNNVLKIMSSP